MSLRPRFYSYHALYAAVFCVYLAFCAYFTTLPVRALISYVWDDAFYYLQVARHISTGQGSTLDGIHPTNGYHPLWMALMIACAGIFPDKIVLLRAALALCLGFHALSSLLMIRLLRIFTSEGRAWLGGALWLVNPYPVWLTLLGLETPLMVCCVLLALAYFCQNIQPWLNQPMLPRPSTRIFAMQGGLLALAYNARTDQTTLALVIIGFTGVRLWLRHRGGTPRGSVPFAAFRPLLVTTGVFMAGTLPWLLVSLLLTGTPTQDSGSMKMFHVAYYFRAAPGNHVISFFDCLGQFFILLPVNSFVGFLRDSREVWATVGAAALLGFAVWKSHRPSSAEQTLLWLLAAYAALVALAYSWLMTVLEIQVWHTAPVGLAFFVAAYLRFSAPIPRMRPAPRAGALAAVIFTASAAAGIAALNRAWMPVFNLGFYDTQLAFDKQVPPGESIGCFNAGIASYFSSHTIVNLDGLVNHAIVPYWQTGTFTRFLDDNNLHYLADGTFDLKFADECSESDIRPHLRVLSSGPVPGWYFNRYLFQYTPSANTPPTGPHPGAARPGGL